MNFIAKTYDRDVIVAEVAYNFAPAEYRNSPAPFPETPDGQKEFLEEIDRLVMETPDGRGAGVFMGSPAWLLAGAARTQAAGGFHRGFDQFTRGKTAPAGDAGQLIR